MKTECDLFFELTQRRKSINQAEQKERSKKGILAVNIGLGANIFLAALKTMIGIIGNSPALLADGINSTSDVAYGIVVNIFMRLSGKPADHEHPYGHDQMESIAAVVVGAFVITTAIAIFWNTVNGTYELITGRDVSMGASITAMWVALFTVGVKIGLTLWTQYVGKAIKNTAVLALAYDHRNDIFSALAATIGIYFGRKGYPWVDPLSGAIVSLIILYTGIEILRTSTADLMDTVPGKTLNARIRELLTPITGISDIEEIHAHRFGPYYVINITIGVNGMLSVAEGDRIATQAEQVLIENIEFMRRVHVHYHPLKTRET